MGREEGDDEYINNANNCDNGEGNGKGNGEANNKGDNDENDKDKDEYERVGGEHYCLSLLH